MNENDRTFFEILDHIIIIIRITGNGTADQQAKLAIRTSS